MADPTDLRVTVVNTSEDGGTLLTPVYFGFHNGNFDLFEAGQAASPGLESLAEDGSPAILATERLAVSPNSQGLVVTGEQGPVQTEETTSATITVDGSENSSVSLAAMILPSNDAFIGTDEAVELFGANGTFLGEQTLIFEGTDVYDAGTEVNTELDAAFINQMAPNTGVDENGVVALHPGFNGSAGNPVGDGDQIILGGTNAFGQLIVPEIADFTLPGAQIAVVHINTVKEQDGTDGADLIVGGPEDDIINALGGNDIARGGDGWDVIDGGDDNDFIGGNVGNDILSGGNGNDLIRGGQDDDIIDGGNGNDVARGGLGDDRIEGGNGNDALNGGDGDDDAYGGNGNDEIDGALGDDALDGGYGNDILIGGRGGDVLVGGADNDRLGGNRGRDEIDGGDGNDDARGGRGDDIIAGGRGNDVLRGGGGEDVFVFTAGDDHDEIKDFSQADELLVDVQGFDGFDDITDAAIELENGTLIDFGNAGSVFLTDTEIDDLNASQFAFV